MPSERPIMPNETYGTMLAHGANKHLPIIGGKVGKDVYYEVAMFDNPSRTMGVVTKVCTVVGIVVLAVAGVAMMVSGYRG